MTTKEHNDKYFTEGYEQMSKNNSYLMCMFGVSESGITLIVPPEADKKLLKDSLETIKNSL